MTIPVYAPAVQVMLIKTVQRKNGIASQYTGGNQTIDITPYLGDSGNIRTRKALREADGRFSIVFADKMNPQYGDSMYALIEPMDMIEIRATRQPQLYQDGKLPLIMRGYVSEVGRPEGMADDGTPQRSVVVRGQDAGKLWLVHGMWFEVAVLQEKPMLNIFSLNAANGITTKVYGLSDFVTTVTNQVMNPKVADLAQIARHLIAPFAVNATVKRGQVIPQMTMSYEGPMWGLIDQFAERPWNELFIQDTETGPVVVFRETLYKDITGKLIMQDAVDPGTIAMTFADIQSWKVLRSDAGVANFFWVPPGASLMDTNQMLTPASLLSGDPLDFNYGNNLPQLYGTRKMVVQTRVVPNDISDVPSKLPADQKAPAVQKYVQWHLSRMADLKAMNRDNIVFERGMAVVRGSEQLQIGKYLSTQRGSLTWQGYMESVEHTIVPLRSWTSTVGLDRGTGFLVRNQYPGSAYLAEGRSGPYSAPAP